MISRYSQETSDIPDYLNSLLKKRLNNRHAEYLDPPGCCHSVLETPYCIDQWKHRGQIELGLFYYHRFAFYYWSKWKARFCTERKVKADKFVPPDLVSLDRHNDFGYPCDLRDCDIRAMNLHNPLEVGLFTWLGLRSLNDGHILPAVLLNLVRNVYLVTKQITTQETQVITDYYGNEHRIFYLRHLNGFSQTWNQPELFNPFGIYWDIDLDYFTISHTKHLKAMPEQKVRNWYEKYDVEIRLILNHLAGFTIALEPEYSGGLISALKLYGIFEDIFFTGPLSRNDRITPHTWRKKYLKQ